MKYFWEVVVVAASILFATYLWQNWNNGSGIRSSSFGPATVQGSECDRIGERRDGMECRW